MPARVFPRDLRYWLVDEVIECISPGREYEKEMMHLMPDAYGDRGIAVGKYGLEGPYETGADPKHELERIWYGLSRAAQDAIYKKAHIIED